jgi:hypothetical protein
LAAPRERSRRARLLAGLLVLILATLAVWLLVASRRAPAPRPPAAAAGPPAREVLPPVSAPEPATAAEQGEALPEAVERYLASTVYPPTSGRLEPGHEDLLEPNRRYERPRPVPETLGDAPPVTALWTTDRYAYTGDEVVQARFEARRGDAPAELAFLEAWAQPEGGAGAVGEPSRLVFRAEGDAERADLDLGRSFPDHHGPILLGVRFALPGGEIHEDAIRIFTTPTARIPARFTGHFRDVLRGGSLVVEVGIDVREGGFYRIDANLRDAAGAPVAWAVFKGELHPSDANVPLEFFGKVIRDARAAGPYALDELRGYRFLDGSFPDQERMRDHPGRWQTRAWELAEFSDAAWSSPQKDQMVELMLEDIRLGRGVALPPVAAPDAPPGAGEEAPSAPAAAAIESPGSPSR